MPGPDLTQYLSTLRWMAAQYQRLKPQHSNGILFFRLGAFYQTFGDDARLVSQLADVPLRRYDGDLSIAEIPVLACEPVMNQIRRHGFYLFILDDPPREESP